MSTLHDKRVWDMPHPFYHLDLCHVGYPVALGLTVTTLHCVRKKVQLDHYCDFGD